MIGELVLELVFEGVVGMVRLARWQVLALSATGVGLLWAFLAADDLGMRIFLLVCAALLVWFTWLFVRPPKRRRLPPVHRTPAPIRRRRRRPRSASRRR